MAFFGGIINLLKTKMFLATPYDWFHILFIILSFGFGVVLVKKFKNPSSNQVSKILFVLSLICIFLEIIKQITLCFSYDGKEIIFNYKWYIFPFQFCSTPMYIGLIAGIFKKGRIHNCCTAYLSNYAVFAGLSVMVWPTGVFTDILSVNIQTMVCHGSMISIGIFLLCTNYVEPTFKTFLKALPIFTICFFIAIILNEIAYSSGILNYGEFNMFYISPYCKTIIPILDIAEKYLPTPMPQIIYFVGFSLIAYLILFAFKYINLALRNKHNK